MKPDNNRIIAHDTKCLHSMLIRPQGSPSPLLLFALRAIDLSTLICPPLPRRAPRGWQAASSTPGCRGDQRTAHPPSLARLQPLHIRTRAGSQLCRKSYVKHCKRLSKGREARRCAMRGLVVGYALPVHKK